MDPDSPNLLLSILLSLLALLIIAKGSQASVQAHRLKHIPTIGYSSVLFSFVDAIKFIHRGEEIVKDGYTKFFGTTFKIPIMQRWMVIISGAKLIEDVRKAPDELMSLDDAFAEFFQTDYTIGPEIHYDTYHGRAVRTALTRNYAACFDDIRDEIATTFSQIVPLTDEWVAVPALATSMAIVSRAENRAFVGLPLCRDADYLQLNQQFAVEVMTRGQMINIFPEILKPILGRLLSTRSVTKKRMAHHVGSMIQHQLEQEKLHGHKWPGRPNNLISWLLEEAKEQNKNVDDMIVRILATNAAAIHTTSHALTHVLYDVAVHPEYIQPMREEIEAIVNIDGWSKESVAKMNKVDSFIKESQRLAISAFGINRKLRQDFTFADGTTVPVGSNIAVAARDTHLDERNYQDAGEFRGFRFANLSDDDEGKITKNQLVSVSPEYLVFGIGRRACPGRFFAATLLKTMLAHVLVNYDVKLPDDGPRPEGMWLQGQLAPNMIANVMFRKRLTV